jgi:hypothetical protein
MNNNINKAHLFRFFSWMAKPRGVSNLKLILRRFTDNELLHLMQGDNIDAAKIAWAELGRRRGFANINFCLREVNVLEVELKGLVLFSGFGAAA